MDFRSSSFLIIKLRNTSRMEQKRFHSQMELLSVSSLMVRRRAYSQMELYKRSKNQELE